VASNGARFRIGVVAPGSPVAPDLAEEVRRAASGLYPDGRVEVVFHPQCFLSAGHFAGPDAARAEAFVDVANDPGFDALWFARGGYGAARLAEGLAQRLAPAARDKAYLGYSDAGSLLGLLYGLGFPKVAHGPIPQDLRRAGGEAAVARALAWLAEGAADGLEPSVAASGKTAAFNITILAHMIGLPWAPDLSGHVVMLEEVSEYLYRIDRDLLQITSSPGMRRVAGLRLGRCSDIPENDRPFGEDEEAIARNWCVRSKIPYLGRADIGHDADNKIVPFGGLAASWALGTKPRGGG
jgi:muramoyltetrapeptide carboxypeptidase